MTRKSSQRHAKPRPRPRAGRTRNVLRIIGGKWRGRRVQFPIVAAIRPTPDRVRETLFNWLQNVIAGSRCLDLFAGSGALGLEALSRGAARVVFVDTERAVTQQLTQTLATLEARGAELRTQDARSFLQEKAQTFDIVFLDPPFEAGLLSEVCAALEERGWLAPHALVYVESPARAGVPVLSPNWTLIKSGRAGEVGYHLARRSGSPPALGDTR